VRAKNYKLDKTVSSIIKIVICPLAAPNGVPPHGAGHATKECGHPALTVENESQMSQKYVIIYFFKAAFSFIDASILDGVKIVQI
jgi:hypothetical protein